MYNFILQSSLLISSKSAISGLLLSATTFFANPGTAPRPTSFDASVYVTSQQKIRLSVQKKDPSPVLIKLSDSKNHVVYETTIGRRLMKTALQFDVSELSDGTYTLELNSADGRIVKQVNLGTPQSTRSIAMQ